jgi:dipeptide transport system substrate-binding protein
MDFASILSKEYADKLTADKSQRNLDLQPVGTGPFVFVGYTKDETIRYKANPDYWRGKPALDELVLAITPDPAVRLEKLKSGGCQVADPAPADVAAIKANPALAIVQGPNLDVGYLAYNTQQKPFDDAKVRQALNMAIDKRALVEAVFAGAGVVAKNPLPPTVWSYDDSAGNDAYDPEGAKKLLDEAGVKDLKLKLWAMPVARSYNPDGKKSAEMIKADLAKVGVETTIVTFDWGDFLRRSSAKDRDGAVLLGWTGDNGDPDNFLYEIFSSDNIPVGDTSRYKNPDVDTALRQAQKEVNHDKRVALYQQAQKTIMDDAPWVFINSLEQVRAASKRVQGYVLNPTQMFFGMEKVSLS